MRKHLVHLLSCAGLLAVLVAAGPADSEAKPAASAEIGGIIHAPRGAHVEKIEAVDRAWADVLKTSGADGGGGGGGGDGGGGGGGGGEAGTSGARDAFVYPGKITADGAFSVPGLLPGRTYDLLVWTRDASGKLVRWEGVTMDYHRAIKPSTEVTPDDRKAIEALITQPPQFYDKVRILRLAADHQHATALVELLRTRDFHSDAGGEVIYRVELWYFENLYGGWAKDRNTEKVVARVRGKPAQLTKDWQFLPELGGLVAGTPDAGKLDVQLPAEDAKRGVVGGIR